MDGCWWVTKTGGQAITVGRGPSEAVTRASKRDSPLAGNFTLRELGIPTLTKISNPAYPSCMEYGGIDFLTEPPHLPQLFQHISMLRDMGLQSGIRSGNERCDSDSTV